MSVSPKSKPTSPRGKSASPSKSISPSKRKQESPPHDRPPKRSNIFEMSQSPPLHSPRVFLPSVTVQLQPDGYEKHTLHAARCTRQHCHLSLPQTILVKPKSTKSAKGTRRPTAIPSFERYPGQKPLRDYQHRVLSWTGSMCMLIACSRS
jgi:hypothetical protein